jgi:Uma2 family endonuclease
MNVELEQMPAVSEDVEWPVVPRGYEMVDGELVEKNVGFESAIVGAALLRLLHHHCTNPFIGWVVGGHGSYQMFPDRPKLVREPDVSFVRLGRFPKEQPPRGHARLAPDLAVEVVSPNDLYYEVDAKVAEYRGAGVRLIWVISPATRSVLVRRLDGSVSEVREDGELSGEDVVPGFRCRVADLFVSAVPPAGA